MDAERPPAIRRTGAAARRYAIGVTVVQLGWLLRLLLPAEWGIASFVLLVLADLLVPAVAERARDDPWHPRAHHRTVRAVHPDRAR